MNSESGYQRPTKQEKRIAFDILDVLEREAQLQGAFICRCREAKFTPELKAVISAFLDAECHGGSLRE